MAGSATTPSNLARQLKSQTLGHWLPRDKTIIQGWVKQKVAQANSHSDLALNANVKAFSDYITANPTLNNLAEQMWKEIPPTYPDDPTGHPCIKSFATFIKTLNHILTTGPEFYDVPDPNAMGLIGFPINAILDWPMATKSGWEFWFDPDVNSHFEPVLKDFETFLDSPASKEVLKAPNGWVGAQAQQLLAAKGNVDMPPDMCDGIHFHRSSKDKIPGQVTTYTFSQLYKVPNQSDTEYLGFKSWDHFFTRQFNTSPVDVRPVSCAENNRVLNNSCESFPLHYKTNVQSLDNFMLKGQPYSLLNMLNYKAAYANRFIGGSVYQAFLSALSYHRWHSPVNGIVLETMNVPGTYYSQSPFQGFANPGGPDPSGPNNSQPYISSVAARGIIFIQAEQPIGLMAIVFVGMAEVSSCEFTVKAGQKITKGEELGMFHFGGSSHCMVFRPEVKLTFNELPGQPRDDGTWDQNKSGAHNLPVNSVLALVTPVGETH